jgi:hypothetical protein
MKSKFLTAVCSLLLTALTATAQFIVTSSSPAEGSVNVPLAGTISFTFNMPLDTSVHYGEDGYAISALYDGFFSVDGVTYSGDLHTIYFQVTHAANTDYVWIVTGARSQSGQSLQSPATMNYTTASSHGLLVVTGTVSYMGGPPPPGSMVAIIDGPVFSDEGQARSSALVLANGDYTMPYIRDGVFWPVAVQDFNGDGEIDPFSDLIGFYDPDQDGHSDSVVVSGSSLSGIDMELTQLSWSVTAREYLDQAISVANTYAPDQQLRMVASISDTVGLDGTCFGWSYVFYSPSQDRAMAVIISSFFTEVDTVDAPEFPPNMLNVPLGFVDSDVAISVAEANGGSQYRAQNDLDWSYARGGNFYWVYPQGNHVFWMIEYGCNLPDSTPTYWRAYVDMETGQLLYADPVSADEPHSTPQNFAVLENFPNPFNASTTLQFFLPSSGQIRLEVLDVAGRIVRSLADGFVPSGFHSYTFDGATLSSGVYFARLRSPSVTKVHKMVLLK